MKFWRLKVAINLNPYQGLKLTMNMLIKRSFKVAINLNPYQGLKLGTAALIALDLTIAGCNQPKSLSGIETSFYIPQR